MIDIIEFKMDVKKGSYYNIDEVQTQIENQMKLNIEAYFDKRPNCYIISVDTDWYDEGENYLLVANVTYKATPNVIDECLCF